MRATAASLVSTMLMLLTSGCGSPEADVSGPVGCDLIDALARQLVDVGVTDDHQPTAGPVELAAVADVVVIAPGFSGLPHSPPCSYLTATRGVFGPM